MKKILSLFFILFWIQSCLYTDVEITKIIAAAVSGEISIAREMVPENTETLKITGRLRERLIRVEGVEQLKCLKNLLILTVWLEDYSFIEHLDELEVLFLRENDREMSLDFLSKLPRLRILYMNGVRLKDFTIDFINNKKLEYVGFHNMIYEGTMKFDLTLKNIPESLKYVDFHSNHYVMITKELLDSLKAVPNVIFSEQSEQVYHGINEKSLKKYPNIMIIDDDEKILPEKYWLGTLKKIFGY